MTLDSRFLIALLFIMLPACSSEHAPDPALVPDVGIEVTTTAGPVLGGRSENGAQTWLGVPFAAPPVGNLRWQAPEPPEAWRDPREALQHPPWCPQTTNGIDELHGIGKGQLKGTEDCLYLDVYAPSGSDKGSAHPVMVWVHGGSNVWGRAELYDGSHLAEAEDVVVVVIQYRLGPLGWFSHPALAEEGQTANFALLDIVRALEWVQENAAVFGGDPDRVTLFGESAGAKNILALLAMPHADGLYNAAIVQSGLPGSVSLDLVRNGDGDLVTGSVPAARQFTGTDLPGVQQLRDASLEDVLAAYDGRRIVSGIRDGVTLPDEPLDRAIARHQSGRGIPIVLGSNRDEAKYLMAFDKTYTKKAWGLFPKARDKVHYAATSDYLSSVWRVLGVDRFAETLTDSGAGPVRTYRFDWDEQGRTGLSDLGFLIGAAHSMEIPFVFGHFDSFLGRLDKRLFKKKAMPARQELSRKMMGYWGNIAYGRAPGGEAGDIPWPAVGPDSGPTLVFDTPAGGGIRAINETRTLAGILSNLKNDPVLERDNRRCLLLRQIARAFGEVEPTLDHEYRKSCREP